MDWIKARLRRPKPTTTVRSSVQDAETRHENIQLPRSETHVREATLCEQCRTLLTSFEREKDYSWKTVHGTLASLMAAVQSHCHFCSEFWYRLTSAQRGSLPQHSPNDKPVVVGMVKKRTGALHDSDDDQYIVSLHASPSMPDRRHATQIFWLGSLQGVNTSSDVFSLSSADLQHLQRTNIASSTTAWNRLHPQKVASIWPAGGMSNVLRPTRSAQPLDQNTTGGLHELLILNLLKTTTGACTMFALAKLGGSSI